MQKFMQKLLKSPDSVFKYLTAAILLAIPLYPKFPFIRIPGVQVSIRLEDFLLVVLTLTLAIYLLPKLKVDFDLFGGWAGLPSFRGDFDKNPYSPGWIFALGEAYRIFCSVFLRGSCNQKRTKFGVLPKSNYAHSFRGIDLRFGSKIFLLAHHNYPKR